MYWCFHLKRIISLVYLVKKKIRSHKGEANTGKITFQM